MMSDIPTPERPLHGEDVPMTGYQVRAKLRAAAGLAFPKLSFEAGCADTVAFVRLKESPDGMACPSFTMTFLAVGRYTVRELAEQLSASRDRFWRRFA